MKKIFAFILIFVTVMLITSVSAFASDTDFELKEYTLSYKALTEIENGVPLNELILIKEEYCLVAPSNDEDGIKAEPIDYAIKKLESANIRITDMVCLYIPEYNGRFVLLITDKKPHLIPFVRLPEFIGLTNGRLYTISNANEIIYRTISNNGELPREVLDDYFLVFGDSPCKHFESFYDHKELLKVMQDLKSKSAPYLNDPTFTAYKEYSFSHDFLYKLAQDSSVNELILGKKYSWVFPSRYGDSTAALKDSKWQTIGSSYSVVPPDSAKIVDGIVRADQINAAIDEIRESDQCEITDVICTRITDYFGKYVCITTEKSAYLIPFSVRPDFTGLENGKPYKLSEAYNTLRKNFGLDDELELSNNPATGDASENPVIVGLTAAIVMILTAKKLKNHNITSRGEFFATRLWL